MILDVDLYLKILHKSINHNNTLLHTNMTHLQDWELLQSCVQTSYLILGQIGMESRQAKHKEGIVLAVQAEF